MTTRICWLAAVLSLLGYGAFEAVAQSRAPQAPRSSGSSGRNLGAVNRPTFSPYLNLLRTRSGPIQNYYGLVKPQQQFQSANEQFDANFRSLERDLTGVRRESDQSTQLHQTGHAGQFMSDLRGGNGAGLRTGDDNKSDGKSNEGSRLRNSGHPVSFGNTGNYFPGAR